MNFREKQLAEMKFMNSLKHESRSGSKKNLFVYHRQNSKDHENSKFRVFMFLIDNDFDVYCEAKFTSGGRSDLFVIKNGEAYCVEILKSETTEMLAEKKYPFEIIALKAEDILKSDEWEKELWII